MEAEQRVHETQTAAREAAINLSSAQKKLRYSGFTGKFKLGQD